MKTTMLKVIGLALMSGVFSVAHAALPQVPVFQDFENKTVGTLAEGAKVGLGTGYTMKVYQASVVEANDNKYVKTNYAKFEGPSGVEIGGFDVAVATPALVNGVAAKSYMVMVQGFTLFPIAREILLPAPGADGLSFVHIGRNDIGGDYGEPYGEQHPHDVSVMVFACGIEGCDSFSKNVNYRIAGDTFGPFDTYTQTSFAIDNVELIGILPVPEPATYGMMLAGLATIGAIVRRRKVGCQGDSNLA